MLSLKDVPKDQLKDAIKKVIDSFSRSRPELISILIKMAISEKDVMDWWDVTTSVKFISELKNIGLIEFTKDKKIQLIDKKLVMESLSELKLIKWKPKPKGPSFPYDDSMFAGIVGYDDVKRLFKMALLSPEPFHILLDGDPGTGKSLFLDSIREHLEKVNACVNHIEAVAGLTTSVGIVDKVLEMPSDTPCVLLIDEIDKMDGKDLQVLARLMETGEIFITKHSNRISEKRQVWVFATSNFRKKLPVNILDRFEIVQFRKLTPKEFLEKVPNVLVIRKGIDPDLARYIAESLSKFTTDIREAIRVAKVCKTKDDVDWYINWARKGKVASE